ncbi:hypothetical protein ACWDAO_07555 [Streptomyces sp. NPDC001212]|uniref:hypothetical protein n=1 Tax=Streptomyces sp. HYC2 TaxID=2955207 RepID=UPI00248159F7|nr:hypothetical protein [Streptomyces sp. HYC2]
MADHTARRTRPGCRRNLITRKTLLELPDPKLPDHPAYQQIMAVFTAADHPLRAR